MKWQNLWGIKSAGTRSKEIEEVVVISRQTSIMKKAPKEEVYLQQIRIYSRLVINTADRLSVFGQCCNFQSDQFVQLTICYSLSLLI